MTYTWPTQNVVGHINLTTQFPPCTYVFCGFKWHEWGWGNEHLAVAGITVHKYTTVGAYNCE